MFLPLDLLNLSLTLAPTTDSLGLDDDFSVRRAPYAQASSVAQSVFRYSTISAVTILTYDYFELLPDEVIYVWRPPYSLGTLLFILNRYLPFVDSFIMVDLMTTVKSAKICKKTFSVQTPILLFGVVVSELILMLRTYAIWERRRIIKIILIGIILTCFIPGVICAGIGTATFHFIDNDRSRRFGCELEDSQSMIFIVAYGLLVLSETIIVLLTVIRGFQHLRRSNASWIKELYREGILFYLYLLVVTLLNAIVPLIIPDLANWLVVLQRVLHSVLCNRVMLLIFRQRRSMRRGSGDRGGYGRARRDGATTNLITSAFEHGSGSGSTQGESYELTSMR